MLLYNCKKSATDSPKEFLTASGWKYADFETREVIDNVPKPWVSHLDGSDNFRKDYIVYFKLNGTYYEENSLYPDFIKKGNWTLLSNNNQIKINIPIEVAVDLSGGIFDIQVLSRNMLQFTNRKSLNYGINNIDSTYKEIRRTFKH